MKATTPDKVAASYSKNPSKLKVQTFSYDEDGHAGSYVLIEGDDKALRMLGEMLIATAEQKSGFDFSFHPQTGALPSSMNLRHMASTSISWIPAKLARMNQ